MLGYELLWPHEILLLLAHVLIPSLGKRFSERSKRIHPA